MRGVRAACVAVLWIAACNQPATEGAMLVGDPNAPCRDVESFRAHLTAHAGLLDKPLLQRWQPPRPVVRADEMAVQQLARQYLDLCGLPQVLELTHDLVKFPTVGGGHRDPQVFRDMATYLRNFASRAHLHFETMGQDDVWEFTLGSGPHNLTLLTHADVVPAGDNWKTDPYTTPIRADDARTPIYGRGVEDDKGPLAVALVTLRTLAWFGLVPRGRVTLAVGTAEETDWEPMQRYARERTRARYTLSLDGVFPVVVAEDGYVTWHLGAPMTSVVKASSRVATMTRVDAGELISQVPGRARALLRAGSAQKPADLLKRVQRACNREARNHKSEPFTCKASLDPNNDVDLVVTGAAIHASVAEHGSNALWWLARLSRSLELAPNGAVALLRVVADTMVADHTGSKLGLSYSDPFMGGVLVTPTVLRSDAEACHLDVNLRRPRGLSSAEFTKRLLQATEQLQRIDARIAEYEPHTVTEAMHTGVSNALVASLVALYEKHAQVHDAHPVSSRAGTYARLFPGAVSFGPVMAGRLPTAHAPDEYLRAGDLRFLLNLYLDMLFKLQV